KEALACGVPAVATSIGGAAEILQDGATGLVVPPREPGRLGEAILSLLNDPARARAMRKAGSLDVAARFTPDRLPDETLRAYETARRSPSACLVLRRLAAPRRGMVLSCLHPI